MSTCDIGVIGLAVMGQNLARNIASRNYRVAVYNRTTARTDEFIAAHPEPNIEPAADLETFVAKLKRPRRILLMVKAGGPVDDSIKQLQPLLESDDIIMDGRRSARPASSSWAWASRAAKRARCTGQASCRAARAQPMTRSRRCSLRLRRARRTARPA
jgi:6-phosphogluconate dehydrogenase